MTNATGTEAANFFAVEHQNSAQGTTYHSPDGVSRFYSGLVERFVVSRTITVLWRLSDQQLKDIGLCRDDLTPEGITKFRDRMDDELRGS